MLAEGAAGLAILHNQATAAAQDYMTAALMSLEQSKTWAQMASASRKEAERLQAECDAKERADSKKKSECDDSQQGS